MAEKLDPEDMVSLEEVMLAQAIEQEALVNILVEKGLIDKMNCLRK